jgi:hypothetical protein
MINVAMGEQKQLYFVPGFSKPRGSLLRRVNQYSRPWEKKTIRVKKTAGEGIDEHADCV